MLRSLALLASCAAFVPPRQSPRAPLSCAAKKPQPTATRDLASLRVGERVSGTLVGPVFQGKMGVKAFLDVGVVAGAGGTRVNGMLRLPHYKQWRNGTDAYKKLNTELRAARIKRGSVSAYVAAVRPDSRQLVLEPFIKPRPPSLKLSELAVNTELRNCKVVGMTKRYAYVDTPCFHDGARTAKQKRRLRARLVLPSNVALATAPVKSASIERVLRLDDLVTCYVRRPEPAGGKLEVGLEPADAAALASEAKARDAARQARARRAAATTRLAVGQRLRGVVVRRLAYGAAVDVGAQGAGLVLRGDREGDFLRVDDRVAVVVLAVEPRDDGPPQLTLELVEEEPEEEEAKTVEPASPRGSRSKPASPPPPEPERESMFDDLDDLDDIEASLGLDEY